MSWQETPLYVLKANSETLSFDSGTMQDVATGDHAICKSTNAKGMTILMTTTA